jgi:hypothetical protein
VYAERERERDGKKISKELRQPVTIASNHQPLCNKIMTMCVPLFYFASEINIIYEHVQCDEIELLPSVFVCDVPYQFLCI